MWDKAESPGFPSPRRAFPGGPSQGFSTMAKPGPQGALGSCSVNGVQWSLTAVGLVLAMLTVVLFVTRPAHGDAPPTGAGKVIEGAPGALHT